MERGYQNRKCPLKMSSLEMTVLFDYIFCQDIEDFTCLCLPTQSKDKSNSQPL